MDEIVKSLGHIGLSDKEAKIYLSLLKFGEATVANIADEATIKRPTAYVILDELRKKGLVIKIPHAKKAIFQAKTPDELYEQTVSNINQFEKFLPKLRSINPNKKALKTLYFEGAEGIKEAMYYKMDELKDSTITGFWAKDNGLSKKVVEIFQKWNTDRQKNKTIVSGVTPDHPSTHEYVNRFPDSYKDFIFAPEKDYSSDVSIEATKEFVRIIDGHDLKALIIENPRIVEAVGQIFAIVKEKYKKESESKSI